MSSSAANEKGKIILDDRPRRCAVCRHREQDHRLANYADGPQVGEGFLVCPTVIFKPEEWKR